MKISLTIHPTEYKLENTSGPIAMKTIMQETLGKIYIITVRKKNGFINLMT